MIAPFPAQVAEWRTPLSEGLCSSTLTCRRAERRIVFVRFAGLSPSSRGFRHLPNRSAGAPLSARGRVRPHLHSHPRSAAAPVGGGGRARDPRHPPAV